MGVLEFSSSYFVHYKSGITENIKLIREILAKLPLHAKVLDVGCGKCEYLKHIHGFRPDLELFGVDVGDVNTFIPEYVSFVNASGDKMPFENETMDFIICLHVLEHVQDPSVMIKEFYRTLNKNAPLFLETPYFTTLFVPDGVGNFWSDPTHIRPFTRTSFSRLLLASSFRIESIKVWRNWFSIILGPYLIIKRLFLRDRDALSTFFANLLGRSISCLGYKI